MHGALLNLLMGGPFPNVKRTERDTDHLAPRLKEE